MIEKKDHIKVYGTSSCPWCIVAKNFFKEHGIEFKEIDVSKNQKAAEEMIEKSGQMGVPVIDINNNIIIGFDENKIRNLLKIKG
ncbi:MAG: glutaredoxin family protein [Candidatus Pacearchaeota archaeon]|nr:glutaredoxin family protein [Candidatus Pacearchaeota archaeon]